MQTIQGAISFGDIFRKLISELCHLKFEEAAISHCCSIFLDYEKDPERRTWHPDKTKTFMENLDALEAWFQTVKSELGEDPRSGIIWLIWPKVNAKIFLDFGLEKIYLGLEEEHLIKGQETLWDEIVEFTKHLASTLPTDCAFSTIDWLSDFPSVGDRLKKIFKRQKVMKELPRLDKLIPKRLERKWKSCYSVYPSFIILSPERYEASRPYISSFPVKRFEELSNGCVFLFFDYPIDFEALRREGKLEEEEGGEGEMFAAATLQPNDDLDSAYERITKAFEEGGFEVYHPGMLNEILPIREFARLFVIFTEEEAHTFFICPYEWTPDREVAMIEAIEAIKSVQGLGKPVIHFISAYPLPKVLEDLSK